MYGGFEGEKSLAELMDIPDEDEQVVYESNITAAPDVPTYGRVKKSVRLHVYQNCPNVALTGQVHKLDPGTAGAPGHTRDAHVVALVDRDLAIGPGKRTLRLSAAAEANANISHSGTEQGWLARLASCGSNVFPAFEESSWADAARATMESFPLNRVKAIEIAPQWYKPNLKSSAGLPDPALMKSQVLADIKGVLLKVKATQSYESVYVNPYWETGVHMLKHELHEIGRLDSKARAYYCFPATTSVPLGGFMSNFTSGIPTYSDFDGCTNLVGISFYHGGAGRLLQRITQATQPTAGFYGDDALMTLVFPSGRRYVALPDVIAMDMNTPDGFKELWCQHVTNHWVGPETGIPLFESGLSMYAHMLTKARFLLPGGLLAKMKNFAATGMTSNTYYQTFVNSMVWHRFLKPIALERLSRCSAEASGKDDHRAASEILGRWYETMTTLGIQWKEGATFVRFKHNLRGLLGHDIKSQGGDFTTALAYVPLGRLMASLINPARRPNKSGTATLQAYARAWALAIAGGYVYPVFMMILQHLYDKSAQIAPTLHIEHKAKMEQLSEGTELSEGRDAIRLPSLFKLRGTVLEIVTPVTAAMVENLRRLPKVDGQQSLQQQLAAMVLAQQGRTEPVPPPGVAPTGPRPAAGGGVELDEAIRPERRRVIPRAFSGLPPRADKGLDEPGVRVKAKKSKHKKREKSPPDQAMDLGPEPVPLVRAKKKRNRNGSGDKTSLAGGGATSERSGSSKSETNPLLLSKKKKHHEGKYSQDSD